MPRPNQPCLETEENSSSEEQETLTKASMSEYEKQRLQRIRENNKRMEALGLKKMASSLIGSVEKKKEKKEKLKGKAKVEEDEEYKPCEEEEEDELSSGNDDDDENDKDFVAGGMKVKYKSPKLKKVSVQKLLSTTDVIDEDDAFRKAIALSLQESGVLDKEDSSVFKSSDAKRTGVVIGEKKGTAQVQEDKGRKKRKKLISNRVQMTEDELIVHFFQFDEAGKGSISLKDLRRMVYAHDFTWSDTEMADMIKYFDSDGDGKLSLDDFRKIAARCNMMSNS